MKKRIAIDMSNVGTGGGVSILLCYLSIWQEASDLEFVICYTKPAIKKILEKHNFAPTVKFMEVGGGWPFILFLLWRMFCLGRKLKRSKVDLIFTVNSMLLFTTTPQIVHQHNLKHFIHRGFWETVFRYGPYEAVRDFCCRYAMKHAACNIFVSDYLKEQAEAWCVPGKYYDVIPNPVSEVHMNLGRLAGKTQNFESSLILGVFNNYTHKDLPTFLRTIVLLRKKQPHRQWHALIIGDGNFEQTKNDDLQELKDAGAISFAGYLPEHELAGFFCKAFCLLSTSLLESFNNVILESMAYQCPVVLSDCCAHPYTSGGKAVLVPPGNADLFAENILQLSNTPEQYRQLQIDGLENLQRFNLRDCSQHFLKLFRYDWLNSGDDEFQSKIKH